MVVRNAAQCKGNRLREDLEKTLACNQSASSLEKFLARATLGA